MSDHPHEQSLLAGDFNAVDMWIKQYDTEVKQNFAKNSDYSRLAFSQGPEPQVANLFGKYKKKKKAQSCIELISNRKKCQTQRWMLHLTRTKWGCADRNAEIIPIQKRNFTSYSLYPTSGDCFLALM